MNCETWRLSDVGFSELALVKERVRRVGAEDHSRWVFRVARAARRAGRDDLYVKIWNPTYIRRDHVLRALDAGFYDERTAPALRALIMHRGVCRGYAMERCRRSLRIEPAFYETVTEATARTGYFHVNFSRYHALRHGNWYSLIDLDSVYPIGELPRIPLDPCAFDSPRYERFVCGLVGATGPIMPGGSRACHHAIRPPAVDHLRRLARLPLNKAQAIYETVRQAIATRRPTEGRHLDLIERE